jgi:hypothetical protein
MIQRVRQTTLRLAKTMIARLRLKHPREAQLAAPIAKKNGVRGLLKSAAHEAPQSLTAIAAAYTVR